MKVQDILRRVAVLYRRRAAERQVLRLYARGAGPDLAALAEETEDPALRLLARGAYARWLFREDRMREANAQFSRTRSAAKAAGAAAGDYVNLFCLCHLALMRGTSGYEEAARFARQARRARASRRVRLALAVPSLPERAFPGTSVTFSVRPEDRVLGTVAKL